MRHGRAHFCVRVLPSRALGKCKATRLERPRTAAPRLRGHTLARRRVRVALLAPARSFTHRPKDIQTPRLREFWGRSAATPVQPRAPPERARGKAFALPARAWNDRNLVDPASSHTLVSKIKPCMSKYKQYTVKLRMAHYISYSLFDSPYYLDNRSNSRANTCVKRRLTNPRIY